MKITCYSLLFVLLLFSCKENNEKQSDAKELPNKAVVMGEILNHESEALFRTGNLFDGKDTILVDETGSFMHSFYINQARFVYLSYNNSDFYLFLAPGDTLELGFDVEEGLTNWHFDGRHARENELIDERSTIFENTAIAQLEMDSLYKLDANDYRKLYIEKESVFDKYINSLQEYDMLHPDFVNLEIALNQINKANNFIQYPMIYNYFNGQLPELPEDYYSFLEEMDFDLPRFVGNSDFSMFTDLLVNHHVSMKAKKDSTIDANPEKLFVSKLDMVKGLFNDEKVVSFVTYQTLNNHLKHSSRGVTEEIMAEAMQIINDSDKQEKLVEAYEKWKSLEPGNKAPQFTGEYIDESPFSSDDLKGKYIFVDVWATWCGPCIAEIPELEELQSHFAGKNIAFVSISIDMKYDAWKAKVEKDNLKGIQIIARTDESKDQILQDYSIGGIPRFMIIDPEGNIVDSDAPRPSGNAREVLEELEVGS